MLISSNFRRLFLPIFVLLGLCLLPVMQAFARQQPDPSDPAAKNEQTIYVPYDKLKDVFEREGRGVFLPYEQFQKLWQEARSANNKPSPELSPVDVILVSAENTATVEKEVMVVNAILQVELLRSGWQKIPLHPTGFFRQTSRSWAQPRPPRRR